MTSTNSEPLSSDLPAALRSQPKSLRRMFRELRGRGALNSFLPVSARELARALDVAPTTVYRAAKRLEQLGYLRRLPDATGTAWTLYDAPPRLNGTAR